jgi:23S rRNA (pseudouridine1915-N3)-methyltransferase
MQITMAHIGSKPAVAGPKAGFEAIFRLYFERIQPYYAAGTEQFASEPAFFDWLGRQHRRVPAVAVLLDSRGRQMASEELAAWLGGRRDQGTQRVVFAVGPADGWTEGARSQANVLLSFGPMTLPHELARVVLAEQVYRACTILAGHPYHGGH